MLIHNVVIMLSWVIKNSLKKYVLIICVMLWNLGFVAGVSVNDLYIQKMSGASSVVALASLSIPGDIPMGHAGFAIGVFHPFGNEPYAVALKFGLKTSHNFIFVAGMGVSLPNSTDLNLTLDNLILDSNYSKSACGHYIVGIGVGGKMKWV